MATPTRTILSTLIALTAVLTFAAPAQAAPAVNSNVCGRGVARVSMPAVHTVASETTALAQAVGRYKAGCDITVMSGNPRMVHFTPTWQGGVWHGYGDMQTFTKLSTADILRIIAKAGGKTV